MSESVFRYITNEKDVRAVAVIATKLCEEMRQLHEFGPVGTVAIGKAAIGAMLLAGRAKEGHRVGVSIRGGGPLQHVFAEATYEGEVRSYLATSGSLEVDIDGSGVIRTGPSIGPGLLTVFEGVTSRNEPHRATVELRTGEVGDDLAYYLQQSLQTRSVVHLGVYLGAHGEVLGAGGVLVELLPNAPEATIQILEKIVDRSPGLSQYILQGGGADQLAALYLGDFGFRKLGSGSPIRYSCRCSHERLQRALLLLGSKELKGIIQEQKAVEAVCEFCGRKYSIEISTIIELLAELDKNQPH